MAVMRSIKISNSGRTSLLRALGAAVAGLTLAVSLTGSQPAASTVSNVKGANTIQTESVESQSRSEPVVEPEASTIAAGAEVAVEEPSFTVNSSTTVEPFQEARPEDMTEESGDSEDENVEPTTGGFENDDEVVTENPEEAAAEDSEVAEESPVAVVVNTVSAVLDLAGVEQDAGPELSLNEGDVILTGNTGSDTAFGVHEEDGEMYHRVEASKHQNTQVTHSWNRIVSNVRTAFFDIDEGETVSIQAFNKGAEVEFKEAWLASSGDEDGRVEIEDNTAVGEESNSGISINPENSVELNIEEEIDQLVVKATSESNSPRNILYSAVEYEYTEEAAVESLSVTEEDSVVENTTSEESETEETSTIDDVVEDVIQEEEVVDQLIEEGA